MGNGDFCGFFFFWGGGFTSTLDTFYGLFLKLNASCMCSVMKSTLIYTSNVIKQDLAGYYGKYVLGYAKSFMYCFLFMHEIPDIFEGYPGRPDLFLGYRADAGAEPMCRKKLE